jgi:cyclophilin family peptidyl-prolyl cis-trans isomerase
MIRFTGMLTSGLLGFLAIGCGGSASEPAKLPVSTTAATSASATPAPEGTAQTVTVAEAREPVGFEEATTNVLPAGFELPPDKTRSGQSAAKFASDVRKLWPSMSTFNGSLPPRVTLETEHGTIEISFDVQAAPNHVRNFLALAKSGYFNGLVFERVVTQVAVTPDGQNLPFEFVTAGCPVGDGSPGRGHIGYFLKPEVSNIVHDAGTVGFWREDADASAGTRFYITLGPAPAMDGQYTIVGKVSAGLEIVRKIADAPPREPGSELPAQPVVIRQATAHP